jgi:hypothetical protein
MFAFPFVKIHLIHSHTVLRNVSATLHKARPLLNGINV